MQMVFQDLRGAARMMMMNGGFSAVVLGLLTLGFSPTRLSLTSSTECSSALIAADGKNVTDSLAVTELLDTDRTRQVTFTKRHINSCYCVRFLLIV